MNNANILTVGKAILPLKEFYIVLNSLLFKVSVRERNFLFHFNINNTFSTQKLQTFFKANKSKHLPR